MPTEAKPITRKPVLIDLALQGGGSHGAFTWGVLDRLLEEPWLTIDGISGTSAGAMNAAVLVYGHQLGGAAGARDALGAFWRCVSDAAKFSPFQRGPLDVLLGRWTLDSSPMYVAMDLMSRLVSPYDVNPMGKNPLREILAELIDFKVLAQSPIHLFITATNVRTGRGKVFKNDAVTPDVLLASACLPTMFQAMLPFRAACQPAGCPAGRDPARARAAPRCRGGRQARPAWPAGAGRRGRQDGPRRGPR